MADEIVSSLGLNAKNFIGPMQSVQKVLDAASHSMIKFGKASVSFKDTGELISGSISTVIDNCRELTESFARIEDDAGNVTFKKTSSSLRSLTKDFKDTTVEIKTLAHNFLAFSKGTASLKGPGGDLLGEFIKPETLAKATASEMAAAGKAVEVFEREIEHLIYSFKLTDKEVLALGNAFRTNNFSAVAGPRFASLTQRAIELHAALAKLGTSGAAALDRIAAGKFARGELGAVTRLAPKGSEREEARVKKSVDSIVKLYKRVSNEVSASDFSDVVRQGMAGAVNNFEGSKALIFEKVAQLKGYLEGLGVDAQKALDKVRRATADLGRVQAATTKGFGALSFPSGLKASQINAFEKQFTRIQTRAAAVLKTAVTPIDIDKIIASVKANTIATSGLNAEEQKLANILKEIPDLYVKIGEAAVTAQKKAAAATKTTMAGAGTGTKQAKVSRVLATDPSMFANVKKQIVEGFKLPVGALNFADKKRLIDIFSDVSAEIIKGKISVQDLVREIKNVKVKDIIPPDANESVNKLRTNLFNAASASDHVTNRVQRLKENVITATNAFRLLVVSELYTIFSSVRGALEESIEASRKLSVQIGQIQSITLDARASTDEWAQALREVSDISGRDINDIAIAAYDALSNQITKTKEDTKEFLLTATELARVVGATPVQAVSLLSSTINAFGLTATNAKDLAAQFYAVVDIGKLKIEDLDQIFGRAGIAGARLGSTTAEMGAALAVLTQNGLTTEDAVTRLNNVFVKMINPTKEMQKLFRQFGVTSGEQFVKLNGFIGAIQRIEEAIKNGNVALEELFPEIRTLVGFLGLSGENAAKFKDALDKVNNSLEAYKEASKITEKTTGQKLAEEWEKIKNVFTVDFANQLNESLVAISELFGGLSGKIQVVTSLLIKLAMVAGAAAIAFTAFKILTPIAIGMAGLVLSGGALVKVILSLSAALAANPFGLILIGSTAAFVGVQKLYDFLAERQKQFIADQKKLGETGFAESQFNKNISAGTARLDRLYSESASRIGSVFGIAFARMGQAFNLAIEKQKAKVTELVEHVKIAFSNVSNIISKTISSIESSLQSIGEEQRNIVNRQLDRQTKQTERYYDNLAELQRSADPNNFAAQAVILQNKNNALNDVANAAIERRNKLLKESNKTSEAVSEQQKVLQIYERQEDALNALLQAQQAQRLSQETAQSFAPGTAEEQLRYQQQRGTLLANEKSLVDQIYAARQRTAAAEASLNEMLAQRKREQEEQLKPLYKLRETIAAASKEIEGLDIEKLVKEAQPVTDTTGKEIKSRIAVINDALKSYREKAAQLFSDVIKVRPQIDQAGFTEDFRVAMNELDRAVAAINVERKELIRLEIDSDQIAKASKTYNDTLDVMRGQTKFLTAAIAELQTELTSLAGKIRETGVGALQPIDARQNVELAEYNRQLKILQATLKEPITQDTAEDVRSKVQATVEAFEAAKSRLRPSQILSLGLDAIGPQLNALLDLTRQFASKVDIASGFIKEKAKINNIIDNITAEASARLPKLFTMQEDAFRKFAIETDNWEKRLTGNVKAIFDAIEAGFARMEALGVKSETLKGVSPGVGGVTAQTKARGGMIYGPSGRDRVPAWLTRGEFVMPVRETGMYLPMLEAMRNNTFTPQVYGMGGRVYSSRSSGGSNSMVSNANINVVINGQANENMGRKIGREINREIRRGNLRFK